MKLNNKMLRKNPDKQPDARSGSKKKLTLRNSSQSKMKMSKSTKMSKSPSKTAKSQAISMIKELQSSILSREKESKTKEKNLTEKIVCLEAELEKVTSEKGYIEQDIERMIIDKECKSERLHENLLNLKNRSDELEMDISRIRKFIRDTEQICEDKDGEKRILESQYKTLLTEQKDRVANETIVGLYEAKEDKEKEFERILRKYKETLENLKKSREKYNNIVKTHDELKAKFKSAEVDKNEMVRASDLTRKEWERGTLKLKS